MFATCFPRTKLNIIIFLLLFISGLLIWKLPRPENAILTKSKPRPYYLSGGTLFPKPANYSKELGRRDAKLMPSEDPNGDRFESQLMFVPSKYEEIRKSSEKKLIFVNNHGEFGSIDFRKGDSLLADMKCPVSTCSLTNKKEDVEKADFVMFSGQHSPINFTRTPNQIYAFYRVESPVHYTQRFEKSVIYNWTITYRPDSTIPVPYGRWAYYDPDVKGIQKTRNYAANKTKMVAWLVSNCELNNDRLSYAHELQKHIQVDIYGLCGSMMCTISNQSNNHETYKCLDLFKKDYKFYLSFENSNCAGYVTEKLYRNALGYNVIPIVMGARRQDYERIAPKGSYIHVEDFASPKTLAEYLRKLDKNDDLYNSYFNWKGTGQFLYSIQLLWCRVCALLHDEYSMTPKWIDDINEWWFDRKTWRRGFWRDTGN